MKPATEIHSPLSDFNPSIKNLAWAMVESLQDGLIVAAPSGHILYMNKSAEQLMNVTFSQAFMRRVDEYLCLEDMDGKDGSPIDVISGNNCAPFGGSRLAGRWMLIRDEHATPIDIRISLVCHDPNFNANLLFSIRVVDRETTGRNLQYAPPPRPHLLDNASFLRNIREAYNDSLHNDHEHCLLCLTLRSSSGPREAQDLDSSADAPSTMDMLVRNVVGQNYSLCRLSGRKYGVLLSGYSLLQGFHSATAIIEQIRDASPIRSATPLPANVWVGVAPINRFSPGIPANLLAMALIASCQAKLSGEALAVRAYQLGHRDTFVGPDAFSQDIEQ